MKKLRPRPAKHDVPPPLLPRGWSVQSLPDGALRLRRTGGARLVAISNFNHFSARWLIGAALMSMLLISGALPGMSQWTRRLPFGDLLVSLAVSLLVAAIIPVVPVEWRASRNRLLIVRYWGGREHVTYLQDGTLEITAGAEKAQAPWTLEVHTPDQRVTLLKVECALRAEELRAAGRLVAYYTHWPLSTPPDASFPHQSRP